MKKKYQKGQYEYAKYNKIYESIKTIIMFALSYGVYLIGLKIAGSNRNYLTILAVLGLLPASKSLIGMIMAFRVKSTTESFKLNVDKHIGSITGLYHLFFTSDDKNFKIDHLVVVENSIIGFSSDSKFDANNFINHMNKHLKMDAITGVVIKIFSDEKLYLKRLDELNSNNHTEPNIKVLELIHNITL